jgi:ribose transport system ATP-binding protein
MGNDTAFILKLHNITKQFPGVLALDKVSFDLYKGEVHVLLGENGAGKSTLIKIISGAYKKDEGEIFINGQKIEILGPSHAQRLGISTVYQEFNLVPYLNVAENIFLGRNPMKNLVIPVIDKKTMYSQARELLKYLGIDINPKTQIWKLGVAEKQMVEIAKVFSINSRICIFDEPTATLTSEEKDRLFALIRKLKDEAIGIIFISHRLEEVFEIGDRITVMRNGQYIATVNKQDISKSELIELMIGKKIHEEDRERKKNIGEEVLRVENLCGRKFNDVNLSVRRGEIVGLAGLVGAGRTEVLRAIFAADRLKTGNIYLRGKLVKLKNPQDAVNNKVGLLPEDRKKHGLIMCLSVGENIIISSYDFVSKFGILNKIKILNIIKDYIQKLRIKTPTFKQLVIYLSGGNQQKVVIARWLSANSDLILLDEPTRGIDVGAKQEVHNLIFEMAANGKAILVASSEIPELLRICDRIYVMHEGCVMAEFINENLRSDQILHAAFGKT